jgi:hypothetical protein
MAKTRSHRRRKHRKIHGGDYRYTESVVGPYPHSAQPGTNVIAQHSPMIGGGPLTPGAFVAQAPVPAPPASNAQTGGKRNHNKSYKRKGGNVLSELAVPAVLLIANQKFGKRSTYKKRFSRSRRYRGKRRF